MLIHSNIWYYYANTLVMNGTYFHICDEVWGHSGAIHLALSPGSFSHMRTSNA